MGEQEVRDLAQALKQESVLPERRRRTVVRRNGAVAADSGEAAATPPARSSKKTENTPTQPWRPGTVIATVELHDTKIPIGLDGRPVLGPVDESRQSTPSVEDVIDLLEADTSTHKFGAPER
jgi:hypothetical protein